MELDEKYNHDESNYGESIVTFGKIQTFRMRMGPLALAPDFCE